MTTRDDTIRAAYLAVTIARDDLVRISSPLSRRVYGDRYDVTRDRALAALEQANQRYNDLRSQDMTNPDFRDYIVMGSTSDNDPIMENVTAANPRHAAAKVHMSSLVPMVNTYQVKAPGNAGEISQQTINDMQAYLQCERFGL